MRAKTSFAYTRIVFRQWSRTFFWVVCQIIINNIGVFTLQLTIFDVFPLKIVRLRCFCCKESFDLPIKEFGRVTTSLLLMDCRFTVSFRGSFGPCPYFSSSLLNFIPDQCIKEKWLSRHFVSTLSRFIECSLLFFPLHNEKQLPE